MGDALHGAVNSGWGLLVVVVIALFGGRNGRGFLLQLFESRAQTRLARQRALTEDDRERVTVDSLAEELDRRRLVSALNQVESLGQQVATLSEVVQRERLDTMDTERWMLDRMQQLEQAVRDAGGTIPPARERPHRREPPPAPVVLHPVAG